MKHLFSPLYFKLLAWFLAASLLAVTATLVVVRPLWQALDDSVEQLPAWGQTAAEHYEQGGKQALRAYLQTLRHEQDVHALLLNRRGEPLARLRMPPNIRQQLLRKPGMPEERRSNRARLSRLKIHTSKAVYHWHVLRPPLQADQWKILGSVRLLVFVAVLALAALFFAAWLGRPIKRLRLATEKIANGTLSTRVDSDLARRRDEIGELGTAFNDMAERLQALVSNKERLLRDISHELRSPLARLEVALALARDRSGDIVNKELDRIDLETQQLKALIDQIMTLVRLDDPEAAYRFETVNLGELCGNLSEDMRHISDIDIKAECDTGLTISGNPGLLRSALENLLHNAIKYAGSSEEISLSALKSGDNAVIRIRDQGPGVAETELEEIFKPFYRSSEARTPDGGYGIGLAIVQRVVKSHGGQIQAQNVRPSGLEVSLIFPLR